MFQAFNVLRYEVGQKYDSHFDAFSVEEYGPQKSQRVGTFPSYHYWYTLSNKQSSSLYDENSS